MRTTIPKLNLIDTGLLIFELRKDRRAFALLNAMEERAVSSVSAFEVLRGAQSQRHEVEAEELLARFEILPMDLAAARLAADIVRANRGIFGGKETSPDAMIAGTAVAHRATLVTLNTRQFARVRYPGLDVVLIDQDAEDWAALVR